MTSYIYVTLDDPLATNGTRADGVNDGGQVVGSYSSGDVDVTGPSFSVGYDNNHGFAYSAGGFTNYDVPQSASVANLTYYTGINNSGVIAGYTVAINWTNPVVSFEGFLYSGGIYTYINVPSATSTIVDGLNNSGEVVGFYQLNNLDNGFLYSNGTYTTFNVPSAQATNLYGINNEDQIVGTYYDGSITQGFLYSNGNFTTINDPSAGGAGDTVPLGINDEGQIVGYYTDSNGHTHGFLDSGGNFTTIDDPQAGRGAPLFKA